MEPLRIKIAKDYSSTPGPRYKKEGENSGELFRETILLPAINKAIEEKRKLIVDLDGTAGYATSFLEESFGGLIRVENVDYKEITNCLEIISNEEEFLKDDIQFYLKESDAAKKEKK